MALVALSVVSVLLATLTATDAAEEPTPSPLALLRIKGSLTFKNFSHFYETSNDHQNFRNEVRLALEWGRRLAPWSAVKLVGEVRDDDGGLTHGVNFQVPETAERRSVIAVKEATVTFTEGPLDVTLGKQIFAWGTADAYNPTDNVNPYDYLDVIDNEKLGVYAAAARLAAGPGSVVFVVVPFFTPSRLPLPRNRWTPTTEGSFQAIVDRRVLPERDVDSLQYALRAKTTLWGVDLSASYYDGFEHTPSFRRSTIQLAPEVTLPRLTPVFSRLKIAGVDFSTTVRKLEIHGEAVVKLVERNGRDDRFQSIGGINYTFDDLGVTWLRQIFVLLEYGRQTILAHQKHSPIVEPGGAGQVGDLLANNAFRDGLVGRVAFAFTEETQIKVSGIVDLAKTPSHYVQVKASHKLTDALLLETGLDLISGDRGTFWGRWRDNDRFFFLLKYFF